MQSASARGTASDVGSGFHRTVITGKDRANQATAAAVDNHIPSRNTSHTPDQTRFRTSDRLRSASNKIPVAELFSNNRLSVPDLEDGKMPRKKYSQEHGLGDPWKRPLSYPKSGKRRETVYYDDLFRLDEDEFLNDNLIGFFLRYLEYDLEENNPELAKKVYFYNSYFYDRVMQSSKGRKGINYESVQKWTRNIDIFSKDFVVVPVNESFHWYVVIICNLSKLGRIIDEEDGGVEQEMPSSEVHDHTPGKPEMEEGKGQEMQSARDQPTEKTAESFSHLSLADQDMHLDQLTPTRNALQALSSPRPSSSTKKSGPGRRKATRHSLPKYNVSAPVIMTLDSLGISRSSTCSALRQYIVEEAKNKKGWDVNGGYIKGMTAKGIPTQPNFSDCGLYLCAYMEKFILDPFTFAGKILQREMDPERDMPLMPSEELRSRMRDVIMELHREQEKQATQIPIPDVGRILLAQPTALSPLASPVAPRTPLQELDVVSREQEDDSEDELQQDQAIAPIPRPARSSPQRAPSKATSPDAAPKSASPPPKSSQSETATTILEMLAKINAGTESPSKAPTSGTRETAITIEDDDEPRAPITTSSEEKIAAAAEDDFYDHPSELKVQKAGKAGHGKRKGKGAVVGLEQEEEQQRRRARSHSAASVNTEYLTGRESRSYLHHDQVPKRRTGHARPEVVVMVPDSQESRETGEPSGGDERKEIGQPVEEDGGQEILEGIE
jgi:Ulp1 protease family, C-terminal catalytic domain